MSLLSCGSVGMRWGDNIGESLCPFCHEGLWIYSAPSNGMVCLVAKLIKRHVVPRALIVDGSDFSVGWKTQPSPRPFLVWKEGKGCYNHGLFLGGMSHPSPKKNGGEKEAYNWEIQPVLNVISIAFLCEENRAENDLCRLSNSASFLFLCPLKVNY